MEHNFCRLSLQTKQTNILLIKIPLNHLTYEISIHMCNQTLVIIGVGVTISQQHYLCIHLLLNINNLYSYLKVDSGHLFS